MPEVVRDRVRGCDDLDLLQTWLSRSATAGEIGDVFD